MFSVASKQNLPLFVTNYTVHLSVVEESKVGPLTLVESGVGWLLWAEICFGSVISSPSISRDWI